MPAASLNITIEKGSTFSRSLTVKDNLDVAIDLTGYTARAKLRKSIKEAGNVYDFTVVVSTPLSGIITWSMAASETALIETEDRNDFTSTKYYYDLEMVSAGGEVTRLLQGLAIVVPEATR